VDQSSDTGDDEFELLALFEHHQSLPPEARRANLEAIETRAPALARRLREMIHSEAASFDPFIGSDNTIVTRSAGARIGSVQAGDRLGDFELLGQLGQGGMGTVFRARQESTGREVAVKVLRDGLAGADTIRRFELEARILGTLDHPHLARVLGAGVGKTTSGRVPWIAMELVRGQTLLRWVSSQKPDLRSRLAVAADIADGVQHAHGKGIVHRDLKPANVLIDKAGCARVLDFGVARAIDPDLRSTSLMTDAGRLVGTIAWMSPEQTKGDPDLIDVRSDVYALGLLTHTLLAEEMPYELPASDIHRAIEIIREREPKLLGRRDAGLRGDVETIVQRALAKEPDRRYSTAAAFAADIRRHLDFQPIEARPSSAVYRLGKLARRHRLAFGLATAGLLALLVGLIGTSTGWSRAIAQENRSRDLARVAAREAEDANRARETALRAREEERRARAHAEDLREAAEARSEELAREEARLRKTNELLRLVLTPGNMNENTELFEASKQLLERAEKDADLLGTHDRELQGSFAAIIGRAYSSLGDIDSALPRLEEARRSMVAAHGAASVPVAEIDIAMGALEVYRRRESDFEERFRPALRVLETSLGPRDPRVLHAKLEFARSLSIARRSEDAAEVSKRAIASLGDTIGAEQAPDVLGFLNLQTTLAAQMRKSEEALAHDARARALAAEHGIPDDHPFLVASGRQIVDVLRGPLRQPEQARERLVATIAASTSRFGAEAATTLNLRDTHAALLLAMGRVEEAQKIAGEIVEIDARHRDRPPRGPRIELVMARLYLMERKPEEAIAAYDRAILRARHRPARYIALEIDALTRKGRVLAQLDRKDEAKSCLRLAFDTHLRAVESGVPLRRNSSALMHLARLYPYSAERMKIEQEAVAFHRRYLGPKARDTQIMTLNLAFTASRISNWEVAAEAYAVLPDLIAGGLLKDRPDRQIDQFTRAGQACLKSGRAPEAIVHLESGYALAMKLDTAEALALRAVVGLLAEAYESTGRGEERARLAAAHPKLLP
jgi:eukaryotic-like serine/threonine-protein kinase